MTETTPSQSNVEDAVLSAIRSNAERAERVNVPAGALAHAQAAHELVQAYALLRRI
jgi:3-dehydroquinate dehydratase